MRKKINSLKIQQKVLIYLIGFIFVILCIFYLAQVVFLKDFYMFIKERSVQRATDQITEVLSRGYNFDKIQDIANSHGFCVYTYGMGNGSEPYPIAAVSGDYQACPSQPLMLDRNEELYLKALSSKNGQASIIVNDKDGNNTEVRDMTSASVINSADGHQYVVFVNTRLSPVQSTVSTLQTQFIIIAVVIIAMAIALAYYLSNRIARPILTTNDQARQLALGNYDVHFDNHEYVEIHELNETLNYAARELKKVEGLRNELIANMSHDLRTPLTMISGYGEMMRDIPGENNAENVQVIIDEANRLTTLVNEILDVSKLQAGVQSLEVSVFDISAQVSEICERLRHLLKHEFKIRLEQPGAVMVEGDSVKMTQVIYNLITNAVNYSTRRREIVVHQEVKGGVYRFAVQDFGAGIPEDMIPYVWDRYYRGSQSHVRAKVGSGIGLSIVKGILDRYGLSYGVESKLGEGSTFWFELKTASAPQTKK